MRDIYEKTLHELELNRARYNNAMLHAEMEYEAVDAYSHLRESDAELECLTESYTNSYALAFLNFVYEDVDQKANDSKKDIVDDMLDSTIEYIDKITGKIRNLLKKTKSDDSNISKDTLNKFKESEDGLTDAKSKLCNALSAKNNDGNTSIDKDNAFDTVLNTLDSIKNILTDYKENNKESSDSISDDAKDALDAVKEAVKNADETMGEALKAFMSNK